MKEPNVHTEEGMGRSKGGGEGIGTVKPLGEGGLMLCCAVKVFGRLDSLLFGFYGEALIERRENAFFAVSIDGGGRVCGVRSPLRESQRGRPTGCLERFYEPVHIGKRS